MCDVCALITCSMSTHEFHARVRANMMIPAILVQETYYTFAGMEGRKLLEANMNNITTGNNRKRYFRYIGVNWCVPRRNETNNRISMDKKKTLHHSIDVQAYRTPAHCSYLSSLSVSCLAR